MTIEEANAELEKNAAPQMTIEEANAQLEQDAPTQTIEEANAELEKGAPTQTIEEANAELEKGGKTELGFVDKMTLIGQTLKHKKEAEMGRELSAAETVESYIPLWGEFVKGSDEKRQEHVEQRLFEGSVKHPLEMIQLAQSIGIDQGLIEELAKKDADTLREGLKAAVTERFATRIKTREEKTRQFDEDKKNLNWLGSAAVGLIGGAEQVPKMASLPLAAATLGPDMINRAAGLVKPQYTVDENGNPVQLTEGDSDARATLKAMGGAAAERFIWMGAGKVMNKVGAKLLEKTPALDSVLGKAVGKPLAWSSEVAKKLSESEGGRWLLKTGEILGKVNDTVHVGSLPSMMLKSRLTELADEVVGLNVPDEMERERFMDWAKKFVSLDDNVELLTSVIGLHVAMGGYSALRARTANANFRTNARKVLSEYLTDEQMSTMSNQDLQGLCRFVQSPGLTAERAAKWVEDVRAEQSEAQAKVDAGETLTGVREGLETLKNRSEKMVGATEEIAERMKSDEQKAVEAAEQERIAKIRQAEWEARQVQAERDAARNELSRIRGAEPSEQIAALEERGVTSWEDAHEKGLIGQDEKGRWQGGAKQAINIHLNGTERMKSAVKDREISGDLAEQLLTLSYCELGNRPKVEREALIDRIIDECNGDEEAARERMRELAGSDAVMTKIPETALEGAENAGRMKGTELHSVDGAVMGCERFGDVKVTVNEDGILTEGLTDALMSNPKDQADVAALLVRLNSIAERTGLAVNFGGDENAAKVANDVLDAIEREGLEKIQRKMDTRARLFEILARTSLETGTTFSEAEFKKALSETSNGRRFVDNHGNVYGFKDRDGVLHFNPAAINYNTPLHEYGHLALEAVRKINPQLWKRGMDLIKESSYFEEIRNSSLKDGDGYSYLKGDEEGIRDEALATLIGDKGEKLIEAKGLGAELKAWLKEFWKAFKGAFGVADLTDEQIEKMTVGDFVDAINAELLRGKEFGTKKQSPLDAKSIRTYDETDGSGSNGMLRFAKNGLFRIPVDFERTAPGQRVVFSRDDAEITDWIKNMLNGYTLRLSKNGKLYVEGRDGLPDDLALVFGRYPEIGRNDTIQDQIAASIGDESYKNASPEDLYQLLLADRRNYDEWKKGRTVYDNPEDIEAQARLDDQRFQEEYDRQRRWENSGMNVPEYIKSRIEDGDPDFDIDWETARELEHDLAEGKFMFGGRLAADRLGKSKQLKRAERLLRSKNINPLYVWKETGFFRGADGKLRFEIPDGKVKDAKTVQQAIKNGWNLDIPLSSIIDAPELFKAYPDLAKIKVSFAPYLNSAGEYSPTYDTITLKRDGILSEAKTKAIDRERAKIKLWQKRLDNPDEMQKYLSNCDALGIAHGTIREVRIEASEAIEAAREKSKKLEQDNNRELTEDLMHEIQHAVQERENFARGMAYDVAREWAKEVLKTTTEDLTALTEWDRRYEKFLAAEYELMSRKYLTASGRYPLGSQSLKNLERFTKTLSWLQYGSMMIQPKSRSAVKTEMRVKAIVKAIQDMVQANVMEKYPELHDMTDGELKEISREYKKYRKTQGDTIGRIKNHLRLDSKYKFASDFEIYLAFAGEVEARNVQTRLGMTTEERMAKPPYETQDHADADQIVLSGWETARELEHDLAEGKFSLSKEDYKTKKPQGRGGLSLPRGKDPGQARGLSHGQAVSAVRQKLETGDIIANSSPHVKGVYNNLVDIVRSLESGSPVMGMGKPVTEKNFLNALFKAGINNHGSASDVTKKQAGDASGYLTADGRTTRVSTHSADAEYFLRDGTRSNMSFVIRRPSINRSMTPNDKVDMLEVVFDRQTLRNNPEDMARIVHDIARFVATGKYNDTLGAAKYNYSGSPDFIKETMKSLLHDADMREDTKKADEIRKDAKKRGIALSQTDTKEFKAWFGTSKVVDDEGKPLAVYHGSTWDPLAEKSGMAVFRTGQNETGAGAHFGTELAANERAEGNKNWKIGKYYLSIKNPLEVNDTGYWTPSDIVAEVRKTIGDFPWLDSWDAIKAELQRRGYDGLRYKNAVEDEGSTSYIAFEPNQIKSVTDNIGTFDPNNPDVRFQFGPGAPKFNRRNFIAGRAMVAEDYGRGERTPGAMAASRELDQQRATPISAYGTVRKLSLPLSELEVLRKALTGDTAPAYLVKAGRADATGGSKNRAGKLFLNADILGMVDKTDVQPEKDRLKQHGFFLNEDMTWRANHTAVEIAHEKNRSEEQLADELNRLANRRAAGSEAGGYAAARQVFADQVAAIIVDMKQNLGGTLGRVQTVGKGLRDELKNQLAAAGTKKGDIEAAMRGEAGAFLDWAYGGPLVDPATGATTSRGDVLGMNDLTGKMFGAWLVMPGEMEKQAPQWSKAIEATIANNQKLSDAFKELTTRSMSEQASAFLEQRIKREQALTTEKAISELKRAANEPISAGSRLADAKETFLVAFHDKFEPVYIRIDEQLKAFLRAKKAALKAAKTPAARTAILQQIETYKGDLNRRMHKLELSRTAYERGSWNEGRIYFMRMLKLENEASKRWGLSEEDRSLYLDYQRVIETQGRSGSDGISPRQASIRLGDMARRLGAAKWRNLQQYGDEFFRIHEQEVLDDPRVERALGKAFVDYCRTQAHYVATKRTWSPEEMDAIDSARTAARKAGVAGGDDVVSAMYKYAEHLGAASAIGEKVWTARLTGNMAAKQEVRSATWEKVDPLMQFARRNQMVLDLKDALLSSDVPGVRDLKRTDGGDYPASKNGRYGHISYMQDGQRRVLIVPRQIADAFKVDPDNAKFITKANGWVRKMLIDWNPAYTPMNIRRNQDSLEKNMPGMRETYLKTALRATVPGATPLVDLASQALVRKFPAAAAVFGKHTPFFTIPTAERYVKILEDPSGWQQKLWAAEDAGDVGTVAQLQTDWANALGLLKGNMFVTSGRAYGTAKATEFGFAFDAMNRKGLKTLDMIDREMQKNHGFAKFLNTCNIFKKNAAQNDHEDMLAKAIGYLHDRMNYATVRSEQESGLMVKRNVSIAEGERSGTLKRTIQATMQQFFNMVEKGVVRHWRNFGERPGEMCVRDGKVIVGSLMGYMLAYGCLKKWLLSSCDDDEEKAKEKYGALYDYADAYHRGYQNCSNYVRENYNFVPIWTSSDGMTTLIMGGALTDEDKLIAPVSQYLAKSIAYGMGIGEKPDLGGAVANATFKAVTPDLQMAGPLINVVRDTVEAALVDNPTDYFRGAPTYDNDLWEARNESWEMRGKFAAAVGARVASDLGLRGFIPMDVSGVDNGRGSAPETLQMVLKRIPIASPVIGRMLKVQVGSVAKRGEPITDEQKRKASIIRVCAKDLLKEWDGEQGLEDRDPVAFDKKIETWSETYNFSDEDRGKLMELYYNAAIQRSCIESYDEKKRQRLMKEAAKQGRDENDTYLMLGDL